MKTHTKKLAHTSVLFLLTLLGHCHLAVAYYDPGMQRWISRDPVDERGFQLIQSDRTRAAQGEATQGANLHQFVSNSPVLAVDAFGESILPDLNDPNSKNKLDPREKDECPPKGPCDFYKAWCEWGNARPANDQGKGWKRNAPCSQCYAACKSNGGKWPFRQCSIPGNGDPKGKGPAWPPGGKFPGGGGPVWPTPGQY